MVLLDELLEFRAISDHSLKVSHLFQLFLVGVRFPFLEVSSGFSFPLCSHSLHLCHILVELSMECCITEFMIQGMVEMVNLGS